MSSEANTATLMRDTGLPVEICKIALDRAKNDTKFARQLLDKWCNPSNNDNKNDTQTYGAVCTYFNADSNAAAAVEVTCTNKNFSNSKEFYELTGGITTEIVAYDQLCLTEPIRQELETKHNCNIGINYTRIVKSGEFSLLTTYSHRDKMGVVIETEVNSKEAFDNKKFRLFSFDCALHIAAYAPIGLNKEDIPPYIRQKLTTQIEKQLLREGKEMKYWAVAMDGKITKWAEQNTLLNQPFIKNNKNTVEEVRKNVSEQIGSNITIKKFARVELGANYGYMGSL